MKKASLIFIILLLLLLMLCSCSSNVSNEPEKPTELNSSSVSAPEKSTEPKVDMLKLSSGSTGGLYQVFGIAWGQLIESNSDINVQVESSGGAVSNFANVNDDNSGLTIGMTQSVAVYEGERGLGAWDGVERPNVRSLFPIYPSISHYITPAKTGIKTIYDFEDKVVCVGPAGGGIDLQAREIFNILGIKPKEIINMNFSDAVSSIKDGLIDAMAYSGGNPCASYVELEKEMEMFHIELDSETLEMLSKEMPAYAIIPMPPTGYTYLDREIDTLSMYCFTICHADLPDEVAYLITKVAYENKDTLEVAVSAASNIDTANLQYVNAKLHPGAYKYYQEIGVEVPEAIKP